MIKNRGRKRLTLRFVLSVVIIVLFSVAISLPFLNTNGHDLYLIHMFNPTTHEFNGKIESYFGFIVIVLTFISTLLNFVPLFKQNERYKILTLSIKLASLVSLISIQTNYFRIVYPNSFIIDLNVSDLFVGFYIFISFMILYFFDLVILFLRLHKGVSHEFSHLSKKERTYLIYIRILVGITLFSFISLMFVPFFRNYTNYMKEQGFEHILDKRTSVDYYFLCIYNKNFNLSFSSIFFIYTTCLSPTILMFKHSRKTIKWIFVSSTLNVISAITAITVGLNNKSTITPILKLEVDGVCIFFITLFLLMTVLTIVVTILYLKLTKEDKKEITYVTK